MNIIKICSRWLSWPQQPSEQEKVSIKGASQPSHSSSSPPCASSNFEEEPILEIKLDAEATRAFLDVMDNPPEPNEAFKAAYKEYCRDVLNK